MTLEGHINASSQGENGSREGVIKVEVFIYTFYATGIENTLSEYPEDVLSHKKKRLIKKFLEGKLRLLRKLCAERKA